VVWFGWFFFFCVFFFWVGFFFDGWLLDCYFCWFFSFFVGCFWGVFGVVWGGCGFLFWGSCLRGVFCGGCVLFFVWELVNEENETGGGDPFMEIKLIFRGCEVM